MAKNFKVPEASVLTALQIGQDGVRRPVVMHGSPKARPDANLVPFNASKAVTSDQTLVEIPISIIDPSPLPPRHVYTPELIAERAQSLREDGQLMPIQVRPSHDNPGRYIIVDGWSRVLAAKEYEVLETLRGEVVDFASAEEAAWYGYKCNEEREGHSDLDRAFFFASLLNDEFGGNVSRLADRAEMDRTKLSKILLFVKLPAAVLSVIETKPKDFGYNSVGFILDVLNGAGESAAVKFAEDIITSELTVTQRASLKNRLLNIKPKSAKQEPIKAVAYSGAKGEGGLKIFDDGIEFKLSKVNPERLALIRRLIEDCMEGGTPD